MVRWGVMQGVRVPVEFTANGGDRSIQRLTYSEAQGML